MRTKRNLVLVNYLFKMLNKLLHWKWKLLRFNGRVLLWPTRNGRLFKDAISIFFSWTNIVVVLIECHRSLCSGFLIESFSTLLQILAWHHSDIHLRIGHPYVSPADVLPSNGFGSLAYIKDAAVVVPAVAALERTPSSESCIIYSATACECYSSSGGPHASGQIWP